MKMWKSSGVQGILIALVAALAAGEAYARTDSLIVGVIVFFVAALVILRFVEGS